MNERDEARELIERARTREELPYFGGCPQCGHTDGYMNVSSCHWFVCDAHKTRWCAGSNLFSDWHDEDEATWAKNAELLEGYEVVEPLREPPICTARAQDDLP